MKILNVLLALLVILSALPLGSAEETVVGGCTVQKEGYKVECMPPYHKPRIDVVFVIDSTGSMADEIRTVKTHLTKIIKEVESGQPTPYLRVGVVAYRDHKLEERGYLYRKFELTDNIGKAVDFIWDIEASGGGDLPEAVADGLDQAINHMNWNEYVIQQNQELYPYPYTKKLIFLIGDAAPHGEGSNDQSYMQGCPDDHNYKQNIEDAQEKGITIYTVSGSGIDGVGMRIFKEIARKTGGSYTHLSYVRQDVQEYYEEEGFTETEIGAYTAEAKKDKDYDKATNSILTNTFGRVAKSAMKAEAIDMGVEYDEPIEEDNDDSDEWINVKDITGGVVVEVEDEEETVKLDLYVFFKNVFDKLLFWK